MHYISYYIGLMPSDVQSCPAWTLELGKKLHQVGNMKVLNPCCCSRIRSQSPFFGMKGWNHQPFSRGNYIISVVKGRCVVSSSFILIPSYQCNHNLYERTLALDGLRLFDYWLAAPVISMKSGGDTSFFLVDSLITLINKGALVKRVTMWSHVARLFMVVQTSVGTRSYSLILGVTAGLRCSPWKRCFLSSLAPCCFPKAHNRPASLKRDGNASTYYIENMTRTNWQTMPTCLMGTCIFIQ